MRLVRSILRRCPNAAAVTRSSADRRAGATGSARGRMATTLEVTFGGGAKARPGDQALGDLSLKHQGEALVFPDPIEPAEEERGRDVIG